MIELIRRLKDSSIFTITRSRGTGHVKSPTLRLRLRLPGQFPCILAGKAQDGVRLLRFHLGRQAVVDLLEHEEIISQVLSAECLGNLRSFFLQLGENEAEERSHVLLGQAYFQDQMVVQLGPTTVVLKSTFAGDIRAILNEYVVKVAALVEDYPGFDDIQDDDDDEKNDDCEFPRYWAASDFSSEED